MQQSKITPTSYISSLPIVETVVPSQKKQLLKNNSISSPTIQSLRTPPIPSKSRVPLKMNITDLRSNYNFSDQDSDEESYEILDEYDNDEDSDEEDSEDSDDNDEYDIDEYDIDEEDNDEDDEDNDQDSQKYSTSIPGRINPPLNILSNKNIVLPIRLNNSSSKPIKTIESRIIPETPILPGITSTGLSNNSKLESSLNLPQSSIIPKTPVIQSNIKIPIDNRNKVIKNPSTNVSKQIIPLDIVRKSTVLKIDPPTIAPITNQTTGSISNIIRTPTNITQITTPRTPPNIAPVSTYTTNLGQNIISAPLPQTTKTLIPIIAPVSKITTAPDSILGTIQPTLRTQGIISEPKQPSARSPNLIPISKQPSTRSPNIISVPKQIGTPNIIPVPKQQIGTPNIIQVPKQIGTPNIIPVPKQIGTPNIIPVPKQIGTPNIIPVPKQIGTPNIIPVPKQIGTPNIIPVPKQIGTPNIIPVPKQIGTPNIIPVPKQIGTPNIIPVPKQQIGTPNIIPVPKQQIGTHNIIPVPKQIGTPNIIPVPKQQIRTPNKISVPIPTYNNMPNEVQVSNVESQKITQSLRETNSRIPRINVNNKNNIPTSGMIPATKQTIIKTPISIGEFQTKRTIPTIGTPNRISMLPTINKPTGTNIISIYSSIPEKKSVQKGMAIVPVIPEQFVQKPVIPEPIKVGEYTQRLTQSPQRIPIEGTEKGIPNIPETSPKLIPLPRLVPIAGQNQINPTSPEMIPQEQSGKIAVPVITTPKNKLIADKNLEVPVIDINEDTICCICQDETVKSGDQPKCGHMICFNCIRQLEKLKCPQCSSTLESPLLDEESIRKINDRDLVNKRIRDTINMLAAEYNNIYTEAEENESYDYINAFEDFINQNKDIESSELVRIFHAFVKFYQYEKEKNRNMTFNDAIKSFSYIGNYMLENPNLDFEYIYGY
jgi:hypothetical protein